MTTVRGSRSEVSLLRVGRLLGADDGPLSNAAVLIDGEHIAAVGAADLVLAPESARLIELPDATALPGLIDSHVHVTLSGRADILADLESDTDNDLVARGLVNAERMLRAGVTTAFDCGARGDTAFRIRDALRRGLAAGPRLLVSGRPVTPTRGHCHFFAGEADGVDGVRIAVRRLIEEEGADGIKIMATGGGLTAGTDSRQAAYPVDVLAAAAGEAHRLGREITAHAHGLPGIRAAADAGIDSIQHATMLRSDWTSRYDDELGQLLAERGIRAVPTMACGTRAEIENGIRISELQPNPGRITHEDLRENARRLRAAGVEIVPGTDVGINLTDFGEELLFELEAYVQIGLSPLETIELATRRAARHLGLEGVTGSLRAGLAADILVVRGEPERDIGALRRPVLVVRGGELIQPTPQRPAPPARFA